MKDKDPNEDEFNKDEQDNINEADDSFGLPDLDFNTLDDEPEADEPEEEGEPAAQEEHEESTSDEEISTATEEDVVVAEETVEEIVEEVEEPDNSDDEEEESEEVVAEEAKTQSTYVPPKPESNTPRIIAALVITVLVSGAIWYFAFYRPEQKAIAEKAKQEQLEKDRIAAAAKKKKEDEARLAAEQAANAQADADEAASKEAVFTTISAPTGRYYIVIASFIDSDMASDLGLKMKEDGVSTALLAPKGSKKFNRLTLGDYDSYIEAQEEANKLKGDFGDGLWVLKY